MIKKIFILLTITLLGFYCTNKEINNLKEKDIIMEQIKANESKYTIYPKNATIDNNTIIPGVKGIGIDYDKSYYEMKEYGNYNEAMTIMRELTPDISIEDNYDKFVVRGNPNKKEIALIFKLSNNVNPDKIINILEDKYVKATFFIDGTYLEEKVMRIRKIKKHETEILSYNGKFNKSLIKTSMSYLETISQNTTSYCYSEKEDNNILNICKKLNKHTIIPNLIVKNNLYSTIKKNIDNALMITIEINNYNEEELSPTIDYIKSKGYTLVTINKLLSED